MEHPSRNAVPDRESPYLRCPHGWTFFLETCEIAPFRWRSSVRIHATDARLVVRVRCNEDRVTETLALQDARECAAANLRKLEERRKREIAVWGAADLSCDERRKAEMLLMAFLWLGREVRQPVERHRQSASLDRSTEMSSYAHLHQQSRGLRDKSCALIDSLHQLSERAEAGLPEAPNGENCRIGKKGNPDR